MMDDFFILHLHESKLLRVKLLKILEIITASVCTRNLYFVRILCENG